MRSYYSHLATTAPSSSGAIPPRPTFRSSAIFPVLQEKGISSRLLFMGYWILKRHIKEISAIVTLRSLAGETLARSNFLILEAKTYRIELSSLLEQTQHPSDSPFMGSLEIEFFSTQNLFFPFPAVVINYYGPEFSTVVHTAQRVYNDFEDMKKNSQTEVPESGFNFYVKDHLEPFIGLINGSLPAPNSSLRLKFLNESQQQMDCVIDLGNLNPYQTTWVYPARHCDLNNFLAGKPGTAKVQCRMNWIFPRLVVGNIDSHLPALSITHSYYDCSTAASETDYWQPETPDWHAASLMLPCETAKHHLTNIYFYPIYSPSSFAVDLEIYNSQGQCQGSIPNAATIKAPQPAIHLLPLKHYCQQLGLNPDLNYAARVIARPLEASKIPARIKLGLDVGSTNPYMPCNICTNLQPFNPLLETKPSTFRWSPILADQPKATVWFMNSSPAIHYSKTAELTITFFRESDSQTIIRTLTLSPHGFHILELASDQELVSFFQHKVGWMTLVSNNPYATTYYFTESSSGVVGGDHGF